MEDTYGLDKLELTEHEKKMLNDWVGFFSFRPTWAFNQLMHLDENIICLFTGNQCLSEDEYVYTNEGPKKVNELKVGDNTLSGKIKSIDSHIDDIYEVSFVNGYKIKVNKDHPFYARKYKNINFEEKWYNAKDINHKYVNFIDNTNSGIDIDNPRLLGYLMSDGYISKNQSLKFTNTNKYFRSEVERLITDIGYTYTYDNTGKTFTIKYDQGKEHPLKKYIFGTGYSNDSFGKIIISKENNIKEFLCGYFNGDGYLLLRNRNKGYSNLPSIEIGFCIGLSRNKAIEFQYMLWRIGIKSYIVKEMMDKSTDFFYRIKVNSFNAKKIIDILDHSKYPQKFEKAIEYLNKNKFISNNYNWIKVKDIKYIGKGRVYGYECEEHEIISYCGMRTHNSMKTSNVAFWNVMSILGILPVEEKNIRPTDSIRVLRFASETLPMESEGKEVRNTQYPEFKKWCPPSLIKKDISLRKPVLILKDPQGGQDVYIEFVSFSQEVQAQAGVQRRRVWVDEHCKKAFYEEQVPRLLASGGDMIFTLTPAQEYMDWEYDEFYERASHIVRTKSIVNRIKERMGKDVPQIEKVNNGQSIAVLMAASDDNPTLNKEIIERQYNALGDDDIIDIRRYGLFKQISGRIFKNFDKKIHVIDKNKYFPQGLPFDWLHARGIDYHDHNNWAIGWMSLSPHNEAFIWNEFYPSPENMVTLEICGVIADKSLDYRFLINKIDPLASKTQSNTGLSVVDDINRYMYEFKKDGRGTGGIWTTWDTKSTRGRDEIRMRLANSRLVGVPFNNEVRRKDGKVEYLPTIWICNNCRNSIDFMWQWRKEQWTNREMALQKDSKDEPQQKWSHFNMVWEGLFKEPYFSYKLIGHKKVNRESPYNNYMRA